MPSGRVFLFLFFFVFSGIFSFPPYTGIADARISDFIYTESAESGGLDFIYTEMRRAGGAAKPESRDAQLMLSRTQTHARTHMRTPAV